jgi:ubiquinone biosynthesis O-methyltransferase
MIVFDNEAAAYDKWYETKLGKFVDEVETECAFSLLSLEKGKRVLDIGCGTGNFSFKLAKMGYRVVGVDVSEEMLAIAKKRAAADGLEIEFIVMDAHYLDFANESFDCVFSMAVFEFLEDTEKALEEMVRVSKPDGTIIMGTINRESDWGRLYTSPAFTENTVFKYAKLATPEDIEKLKPGHMIAMKECLFIPPDTDETAITPSMEEKMKGEKRGGFICVAWRK